MWSRTRWLDLSIAESQGTLSRAAPPWTVSRCYVSPVSMGYLASVRAMLSTDENIPAMLGRWTRHRYHLVVYIYELPSDG